MNKFRLMLIPLLVFAASFAASSVQAAESCRSCEGLESGGGLSYYQLAISGEQAYAPGKVTFYEKANDQCCHKGTAMAYPSSRVVKLDKKEGALYLMGLDGKREGGFTRGILRYDLAAATMGPVATRIHGEKRCKTAGVFALIHALTPPAKTQKKGAPNKLGLSVLNLDGGYGAQLSAVVEGTHLVKEARSMSMTFSKDCKTLTYSGKKRGEKLSFKLPEGPEVIESKGETEIRVAVTGNIVTCPKVEQGEQPQFPVELSFSVKEVVPIGDIGTEGLETLTYKVGKKAFENFNMIYLRPDTPVQVVIRGTDQLALKDFQVVSVEHR